MEAAEKRSARDAHSALHSPPGRKSPRATEYGFEGSLRRSQPPVPPRSTDDYAGPGPAPGWVADGLSVSFMVERLPARSEADARL